MSKTDLVAILAAIGAFLFLMLRVASCAEAAEHGRSEQALECIKQGVYCGRPAR